MITDVDGTLAVSLDAARRLRNGDLPHVPPAAAPTGATVRLDLRAPAGSDPEVVVSDARRGATWRVALLPGTASAEAWHAELLLPQEPTVLSYSFALADGRVIRERRQIEGINEPLYGVWQEQDFRIAVYSRRSVPPAWTRGAIVYQIVPDRFATSDPASALKGGKVYGQEPLYLQWGDPPEHPPKGRDFYGGDLRGIIGKLDYLGELGISCLYLTPIFASPTNHRYDTLDYLQIDPRLGDGVDFEALITAAAQRGVRIVLDGVFNHCSSESRYFREAQASRHSPYYRWFDFQKWPAEYTAWVGVREMPEFVECPEVEDYVFGPKGVARCWLRRGIAGWRLDVVPWVSDEYWRRFRRALRGERDDVYLVAEDWGDATPRLVGDSFDATMNYRLAYTIVGYATGRLTPSELDDRLETLRRDTPAPAFHAQMNLLSSHDTPRLLTMCGGDRARHMLAAALQLAYPGVPMIYYGDEVGIEGDYAEAGRRAFPWQRPAADLLDFYRIAINARRSNASLAAGAIKTIWIDDAGRSYGFVRSRSGRQVVALFNGGDAPVEVDASLPLPAPGGSWADLLQRLPPARVETGRLRATLPPCAAGWFAPTAD